MKSTGMTRPIDPLGRITLPMELRRTMNLMPDDRMEIYVDGNNIILRKYGQKETAFQALEELKDRLTDSQLKALSRALEAVENVVK